MATTIETARAYAWLYSTLTGDATLQALVGTRVYRDVAPAAASYPLVVFSLQAGTDLMVVGATRVWSNLVCVVRAVGLAQTYATLQQIASRIDELLHAAVGTDVLMCVREVPIDYTETDYGESYAHVGGQYRLLVR